MADARPSRTAQHVAATRLSFERLPAPHGDPGADLALARDVAGDAHPVQGERMVRYLQGRTAFFDRVVVRALERGTSQVLSVAAGYDGRALRYAKPGVRWFEVDLPDTQGDKLARLQRLGVETTAITFVAFDLREPGLADALIAAGVQADAPALIICEGVLVYLESEVIASLAAELRALATAGTRLAVSSSAATAGARREQRAQFEQRVAELGEPTRNRLDRAALTGLLEQARWRSVELSERAQSAGLVVAAPRWAPAPAGDPRATRSRVGAYLERLYHRAGGDDLAAHLEASYAVAVRGMRQLEAGVWRVSRADGPDWLARVFPAARAAGLAQDDAELLGALRRAGFPAERCAHARPVSEHSGQSVLVTDYVPGGKPPRTTATFRRLGELLGRLGDLELDVPAARRAGGAWHHLVYSGGPGDELAAARDLLEAAAPRAPAGARAHYDALADALAVADGGDGLPEAFIHADLVPANAVATRERGLVIVDWAGAGRGPRLWPLAFLLWAAGMEGMGHVDAAASSYREHVSLTPSELERLEAVILARPLVFTVFRFANGSERIAEASEGFERVRERAAAIARRAAGALAGA